MPIDGLTSCKTWRGVVYLSKLYPDAWHFHCLWWVTLSVRSPEPLMSIVVIQYM